KPVNGGKRGLKQPCRRVHDVDPGGSHLALLGCLKTAALDGHETRAEAFDAGEILVAARLIDDALAAELGLERLHRDAVGDDAAIAAALADEIVDKDALGGVGIRPPL